MDASSANEVASLHTQAAERLIGEQLDRVRGIVKELTRGEYTEAALQEIDLLGESVQQTFETVLKIVWLSK